MRADYDPELNAFVLLTGLHEGDLAKQVPGATWKSTYGGHGAWVAPATWPAYVAVNGVFAWGLEASDAYAAWGKTMWEGRFGPLVTLRFMEDFPLQGPTAERLWPLQRVAAWAMVFAERYAEMDEMGGGKTRSTLAAAKLASAIHGEAEVFPMLVVCPNKVRRTWVKEALDDRDGHGPFWEGLRIEALPKGKPAQRKLLARLTDSSVPEAERPQVVVANWEALPGLSRLEAFGNIEMTPKEKEPGLLNEVDWRTVVADEAHRAKDRKSKQTRALKAIAFGTPRTGARPARFRWALTGTPVANNSAEAWSILNFLDEVAWPAYSRMVERYATTMWNQFGGMEIGGVKPETREEFYQAFDPYGIRRLRVQFDPFKPKVLEATLSVPMEPKQASAYAAVAKDMIAQLDGGVLTATTKMTASGRLHQLSQAWGEMVDKGRKDPETGETLLDLQLKAPSNKVRAMLELIEEIGIKPGGGPGRSIVFGASSRQLIALCEEALIKAKVPYCLIAGSMSDQEQEQNERAFETGSARVALCVISAAKEGLNSLVSADTLVFLQRSWSRVENEQFQARVDRPGQKAGSVSIIDVVSEGTLEEVDPMRPGQSKVEKLGEKYANFQEVVNDDRTFRVMLEQKAQA